VFCHWCFFCYWCIMNTIHFEGCHFVIILFFLFCLCPQSFYSLRALLKIWNPESVLFLISPQKLICPHFSSRVCLQKAVILFWISWKLWTPLNNSLYGYKRREKKWQQKIIYVINCFWYFLFFISWNNLSMSNFGIKKTYCKHLLYVYFNVNFLSFKKHTWICWYQNAFHHNHVNCYPITQE